MRDNTRYVSASLPSQECGREVVIGESDLICKTGLTPNGSSLNWILPTRVGQRGEYNPLYREPHFKRVAECHSQTAGKNCRAFHRKTVSARRLNGSQCWLMRLPDSHFLGKICTLFAFAGILVPNASCARGFQESSATASGEFSGSVWRGFSHEAERLRF